MERNGIGYISPRFSADDFLRLHLTVHSSEVDWERAIEIFRDRIEARYFDPITNLLERADDIERNGFAVMALNCLLVDTFYQFRDPDNLNEPRRRTEIFNRPNGTVYKEFLIINFPHDFDEFKANLFYKDIRCGILHSAQTKHGSQLTYDKDYVVEVFDGDKLRVDIRNFSRVMRNYFVNYIHQLEIGDFSKRESFVKQMNKISRT